MNESTCGSASGFRPTSENYGGGDDRRVTRDLDSEAMTVNELRPALHVIRIYLPFWFGRRGHLTTEPSGVVLCRQEWSGRSRIGVYSVVETLTMSPSSSTA